ncbi:hypothetical protein [Selenomonas ruminantium]|uniref:hypothetical protein n=1 Tax=Selenomonas ruminantium TaxID=971 RepID=UPI0026F08458|nr:hypothetical protein [Selenomonas ruminantium]
MNDSNQILLELGPTADPDGEFYCSENGVVYIQQIDGQDEAFAFYDSAEPDEVFVKLRDLSGREIETKSGILTIQRDGDKDYIICNAAAFEFEGMQPGCYYLSLIDYGNNYYSDVFVWKENVADLLMLEWWDNQDFEMDAGRIVYELPGGGTYKNRLYLASDIAKPEYTFDEEGETRDGYFFPTKMISEKRYRFSFWAPEYLLDALRFVRMADNIRITHKGQEFAPDTFLITPEWQAEGDLAAVDAEFETDTVAKKINFVK